MRNSIIVLIISFSCFAINNAFQIKPKIVNGSIAIPGQFPYFAFLISEDSTGEKFACGASLLSDEWLVTAAHCLEGSEMADVHLGKTQRDNKSEPGHVAILVRKDNLHIHPRYFEPTALNDIALIHLPEKVKFSQYIKPVGLPTTCASPENVDVFAIGHGATADNSSVSLQLYYAELKTIPKSVCNDVYPMLFERESVVCASSKNTEAHQSVCRGDSGGPLVAIQNNTLIAVSAFVRGDIGCEQGVPQGFTNLYSYLSWIKEHTGLDLPDCPNSSSHKTSVSLAAAGFLSFLIYIKSYLI